MSTSVCNKRFGVPGLLLASFGTLSFMGGCGVLPEETTTLDVVFDRTGTLARDGAFGPIAQSPFQMIIVGDGSTNLAACGFVSINLNSVPASALVSRVVLNLRAVIPPGAAGTAFADFGAMTVDHVNVVSGITAPDYVGGTITPSITTVQPFTEPQNIAIDVTSAVNADRAAGRPISSFRFRFDAAPSLDGQNDLVGIDASIDDPAQRPSATVTILRQNEPGPVAP